MTVYGNGSSGQGIVISVGKTGTYPNETPLLTSDVLYLLASSISVTEAFPSRIVDLPTGLSFGMKDGKRNVSIVVGVCYVVDYVASSDNTDGFNQINTWLKAHHMMGEDPLYFWIYNFVDGKYLDISITPAGLKQNHLVGYVQGYQWRMVEGNVYQISGLKFKECLK